MFRILLRLPKKLTSKVSFSRQFSTTLKKLGEDQWQYRTVKTDVTKDSRIKAEIIMTTMWYFVLWHLYYNPDRLIGHFPYVQPNSFTDEELGIPSE